MSIKTAFRVRVPHRPGELLRVASTIAQAGINIDALAGVAEGKQEGVIEVLTSDTHATTQALRGAGLEFREREITVAWIPDRPGTGARALAALAEAGINLDSTYIVSTDPSRGQQIALGSDDPQRADQVLSSITY